MGGEGFAVDGSLIKADASRQKGVEGTGGLSPESVSRAARGYLAVPDDAAFGAATPVLPRLVSPSDPAARWTGADGGLAHFACAANYLIDLDHAIIVDVEPTTAIRQAEVTAAKRMIERSWERFDLYPARLAGDSGYGAAAMLGWLVYEQGIEPHIPVFDRSARRDGTFSREDFAYDPEREVYRCPADRTLTTTGRIVNDDATIMYRASTYDCEPCALKPKCCPNGPQDPALNPRRRSADGWRYLQLGRGPDLAAGTQGDRDAVRPSQAHPEARLAPAPRSERSPRRVPPRCHSPEPQEARQAHPDAHASPGVRLRATHRQDHGRPRSEAQNRVLQRNREMCSLT